MFFIPHLHLTEIQKGGYLRQKQMKAGFRLFLGFVPYSPLSRLDILLYMSAPPLIVKHNIIQHYLM